MSDRRAKSRPGDSYLDDDYYRPIESQLERKHGLPDGLLGRIRKKGEKTDRNRVSSAGARSVYQIIPGTRDAFLRKYGINAYSGDQAAAEVAALHLKESMGRNAGNIEASVREYHGGPNRKNWGPVNQSYADRVMGRVTVKDKTREVRGTRATNPGVKLTSADFIGVAPADVDARRPLDPKPVTPKDVAPKPTGAGIIMQGRVGVALTPGSSEATATSAANAEREAVDAKETREFDDEIVPWYATLGAAIDKNWVANMVVRGMNEKAYEGDPAWHKKYLANIIEYEKFAQNPDELDMLRSSRAQNSEQDYEAVKRDIYNRRRRDWIIDSGDNGWAWNLGTGFADPVGWAVTAGVAKAGQVGRVAIGSTTAKAGALEFAADGAIGMTLVTGALDYSGENQTATDYFANAGLGATIGYSLYGLGRLVGSGNDVSDTALFDELDQATASTVREIRDEAITRAGPNADEGAIQLAEKGVINDRAERAIRMAVGDRPDADRFLPADAALTRTGDAGEAARIAQGSNLDRFPDPAERALATEIAARSQEIANTAQASGALDKGLEGRFLKMFGQESEALTLLRSESPVLRAAAIQLLESTTGAGGRKPSAAISMVMRERSYMRHMIEYDQAFDLWRRGEGIGKVDAALSPDARRRFDQAVFREVESRSDDIAFTNSNPAVRKAADAWEKGMDQMRREMQRVGTLGHERLGASSKGYMRHMMDPRKLMALDKGQRRQVEAIMARQFQSLNEYSFINDAGEKVVRNFDAKFSRTLARRYLDEAMGRARGSMFVPANLHTSESASIIRDALTEIQGLAPKEAEAILGKFSRGGPSFTKGRLLMDLSEDIGSGMQLGDLFNQDILGLYRGYARRTAGEVSLAQYGILGKQGLQLMRRTADAQGASIDELKAFERISSEFLNEPWGKYDNIGWAKNLRAITSATRLGGMGFTQLGELGNALPAVGVRAVLNNIASVGRLRKEVGMFRQGQAAKNPILDDLDELYGFIGGDDYNMTRLFDAPESNIELYDDQSIGLLDKAIRGGSHFTSVASGFRMIHAVQVRGMSEAIVKKAIRYIHLDKESRALKDMGITDEMRDVFKANMKDLAEFDSKGNLTKLDIFGATGIEPRVIQEFAQVVERGAGQIIQKTFIGETGPWAHNEFLKLLFQFRTFGLTSIEKQFGRQKANYGAIRAFAVLVGAMSFALPIHLARVHAQTIGLSRSEREKKIDERTNALALARATMQYTSIAGLAPDLFDVAATFGSKVGLLPEWVAEDTGVRGRQPGLQGLVPGVGVVNDGIQGTVGADFGKLVKLLPGSNLPFVTPIINGLTPEDE